MNTATETESPYRSREEVRALVENNLNLARYFAAKWANKYGEHDALSDAMQALWIAARKWDERVSPGRDGPVPFGSYASLVLSWRMPERLESMNRACRGGGVAPVSLDEHRSVGDFTCYTEFIECVPDESVEMPGNGLCDVDREYVVALLAGLSPRQREVLERRFGLNGNAGRSETLWEIANTFGVTNERVRQIERDALETLRARVAKSAF